MSKRLDKEREARLQPERMEYATRALHGAGIKNVFAVSDSCLEFDFNDQKVRFFPYSGWHTGKSIKDGRGLHNLLNQIKPQQK